jgi:NAD(P)H-nitrite reductase large subunit
LREDSANLRDRREREDHMKREKIACNCHNVSYGKIIDAVHAGADTVEKIGEATGAGTGCGGCRPFLASFLEDMKRFPEDYQ